MLLILFAIIGVAEIASTILVFLFKDVLHSIIALADAFLFNAALFLILGQPIIAMLQLFIMIGGVATYLFVGVSSENLSDFKHVNMVEFCVVIFIMFALLAYPLSKTTFSSTQSTNIFYASQSQQLFSSLGIIYLICAMLFGIGIASIVLLKRLQTKTEVRI